MSERDPLAELFESTWRECRKEGLSIADTADILAAATRAEILDKIGTKEAEGMVKADHVMVQSIVGAASGNPAVQCRVGFEQWQWDVEHAREHALNVLTACEAAVHDAAVLRWLTLGDLGLDTAVAHRAIFDLRRFRGDALREDWRPPEHEDVSDE